MFLFLYLIFAQRNFPVEYIFNVPEVPIVLVMLLILSYCTANQGLLNC